jgi:hypothetical protein
LTRLDVERLIDEQAGLRARLAGADLRKFAFSDAYTHLYVDLDGPDALPANLLELGWE